MITPSPLWETFEETFTKLVKKEIQDRGLDQKRMAVMLEVPESTLSLQLNRNLRPWFVDRVAEVWPEKFKDAPVEARRAMLGGVKPTSGEITHLRAMLLMFEQMKESAEEGIRYSEELLEDLKRREVGEES